MAGLLNASWPQICADATGQKQLEGGIRSSSDFCLQSSIIIFTSSDSRSSAGISRQQLYFPLQEQNRQLISWPYDPIFLAGLSLSFGRQALSFGYCV
jgi:hypothetical protein